MRYRVAGVDCAVCAQGIEDGIRKLEGVRSVTLDFATLTLHVEALDLASVESEARRIEPALGLERIGSAAASGAVQAALPGDAREIARLGLALLLAFAAFMVEGSPSASTLPPWALPLPFAAAWLIAGWEVLGGALRNILRGQVFDELFLMSIATIGAMLIGQYEEAVGVMLFYRAGELIQERAVARSRASVRSLQGLRPSRARVKRPGGWVVVPADEAVTGDLVLVLPGEAIAADGLVETGESLVDSKALTGESAPCAVKPGSALLGGSIAIDGALEFRVARPASESQAARIAGLVEEASARKARTEKLVTRIARWYTPLVVGLAAAVAFIPPLVIPGATIAAWGYRALVMLVISCPCALVISIPLGYFAGIGGAARAGILVKGGQALDALARVDTVVFDKTGTLSEGAFEVLAIEVERGRTEDELLELAVASESRSSHLIALAVRKRASDTLSTAEASTVSDLREYAGRGVMATVDGRRVLVGNRRLLGEGAPQATLPPEDAGATSLFIAIDGAYAGRMLIGDRMKAEAASALTELSALGVARIALLTGDAQAPANRAAAELGIAEVHAALTPEGKLVELERIMGKPGRRGLVMFVGDGTNDAPVIARADLGLAMGAGTDAAVETADVVLISGRLDRVPAAIRQARRTRRIISQNLVFAIGIKAAFLVLGAAGIAGMWFAVAADVGVALLAVMNATRALSPGRPATSYRG